MAWRRGVVTMVVVVVVVVLAPKWNEQRKNEPGVSGSVRGEQGRGHIQTMDSTYPTNANTSVENEPAPSLVGSEGTWGSDGTD